MKLRKISGRNFLSFKEFEVMLPIGIVSIIGENRDAPGARSNGSGKTSIVDALSYSLYGETTRGVSGDAVINIEAQANCEVTVEFDDGTTITRYRKHKQHKNGIVIIRSNQEVQLDRQRDTQKQIDSIVGMDWLSFRQAVLFGQDAVRFLALVDSEKKAVIERILGVEVLDDAASLAREDAKTYATLAAETERHHNTIKIEIVSMERELAVRTAAYERWMADQSTRKGAIEAQLAQDRTNKLENDVRIGKLESELSRAKEKSLLDLTQKEANAVEIDAIYGDAKKSHEAARKNETSAMAAVMALNTELAGLNDAIAGIEVLTGSCPTCRQEIHPKHKQQVTEVMVKQRATLQRTIQAAQGKLNDCRNAAKEAAESETAIAGITSELIKDTESIRSAIRIVETKLKAIKDEADRYDHDYLQRAAKLGLELANLSSSKAPDTPEALAGLAGSIAKDMASLKSLDQQASEAKSKAADYEFWADAFGLRGLRSMILDGVLPFIESRSNDYLKDLTGGTTKIALSPVSSIKGGKEIREAVSVTLASSHGANSYAGLSGGERQRVDVAAAVALFDLARTRAGVDIGLAVFDEIFERLDDAGCEAVGALLRSNAARWGTVLLITHIDSLLSEIPNRIRVVKERGESKIEVEQTKPYAAADGATPKVTLEKTK